MAQRQAEWVSKKEIRQAFHGKESTLDNALQTLRERHIIMSREGQRGIYRLQNRGFAMWIKLRAGTREPEAGRGTLSDSDQKELPA